MRRALPICLALSTAACPPAPNAPPKRPEPVAVPPAPVAPEQTFAAALGDLRQTDESASWSEAKCDAIAASFGEVAAASTGRAKWKALYDAGVAEERCGRRDAAQKLYRQILADNPKFLRARVRLAVFDADRPEEAAAALGRALDDASAEDAARGAGAPDLSGLSREDQARHAEEVVKEADAGGADRIQRYEDAANLYASLWQRFGDKACRDHDPSCRQDATFLYNAAHAYQAARLIGRAIKAREALIAPELGAGELATRAMYEIGANYQAIAMYADAADWYERFAREHADDAKAVDALSDAVVLRIGLGQEDKAVADAARFQQDFGAKNPARATQVAFALGAERADRGDWKQADKTLAAEMAFIDASATLDIRLQAHAIHGRALAALKKDADAEKSYALVRDAWKDPAAAIKQIEAAGGSEGERMRRLGKTLNAVGEAMFFFAEKERAKAALPAFPAFKGRSEPKELAAFVRGPVADWFAKRRAAAIEAERHYLAIVELSPVPPPRWVVASGAAVGAMWSRMADDVRKSPYPKDWDKDGNVPNLNPPLAWHDLRDAYRQGLEQALEQGGPKAQAKAAYRACVDHAVKLQWLDATASSCRVWLADAFPAERWRLDPSFDEPTHATSPLGLPAQPLAWDGETILDGREEALVLLAALQPAHAEAAEELQRALALDDQYAPAFAGLARHYLDLASTRSGDARAGMLSIAELVCSQGIRKQPNAAVLHETVGLIAVARGDAGRAAQAFGMARRLDPRALAPRLDFGALNLAFGGFREAEASYREAVAIAPSSFEARIGVAIAAAAQLPDGAAGPLLGDVTAQLAAARDLDAARYRRTLDAAGDRLRAIDATLPH